MVHKCMVHYNYIVDMYRPCTANEKLAYTLYTPPCTTNIVCIIYTDMYCTLSRRIILYERINARMEHTRRCIQAHMAFNVVIYIRAFISIYSYIRSRSYNFSNQTLSHAHATALKR